MTGPRPPFDDRRWRRASELFEEMVDLTESARARRLAELATIDPELAEILEELLGRDRALEPSEVAAHQELAGEPGTDEDAVGDRTIVGRYRILGRLGGGGQGEVFLAERLDGSIDHRVAVKRLPPGAAQETDLRRLRREGRILARLRHPGIAGFLDADQDEDGRPFVVLEHVDGLDLVASCDTRRLGVEERLELLEQTAEAVRFAHENLVVHRDLKPSNILVDDSGRVRLLDFGIARLLGDPSTDATTLPGERLLSLPYASPETLAGEPAGIQADLYALGVLFYEVLTGIRPWDLVRGSLPRVDGDPVPPPSTAARLAIAPGSGLPVVDRAALRGTTPKALARRLRGDLDAIIQRCLEPLPHDRYRSVAELLDDLAARRLGLPLRAGPGGRLDRVRRFVRRNAAAVVVATLAIGGLVGFGLRESLHAQRSAAERDAARRAQAEAEETVTFLNELFLTAGPYEISPTPDGGELTARQLLDGSATRLLEAEWRSPGQLAEVLFSLGTVHNDLADFERARELHRAALDLRRDVLGSNAPQTLASRNAIAVSFLNENKIDDAARELAPTLRMLDPTPTAATYAGAEALRSFAEIQRRRGRHGAAIQLGRLNVAHWTHLDGEGSREATRALRVLASSLRSAGRPEAASRVLSGAFEARSRQVPADHPDVVTLRIDQGIALQTRGAAEEAERVLVEALSFRAASFAESPSLALRGKTALGHLLRERGAWNEAREVFQELAAQLPNALGDRHPYVAITANNLGLVLLELDQAGAGERYLRQALALGIELWGQSHPQTVTFQANVGLALHDLGRLAEGEAILREVWEGSAKRQGADPSLTAILASNLADLLYTAGDLEEAEDLAASARRILATTFPEGHPRRARGDNVWAACRLRRERERAPGEVLDLLRTSAATIHRTLGKDSRAGRMASARLATLAGS